MRKTAKHKANLCMDKDGNIGTPAVGVPCQPCEERNNAKINEEPITETSLLERDKILESIGDGFFAMDRNWIITYWNNAAEFVMGRTRDEVIGTSLLTQYPEIKYLRFYKQYQKAIRTGKAVHFEELHPPTQSWFSVHAYPAENGLSVFFKDITESKLASQALADSEKRYSDLFHLSPVPMLVYDMSTLKYLDVNLAAIERYGYSREEFLSMTVFDIRPEEDIPLLQKVINEKQNQLKASFEGIFRHRKKNGQLIRVDIMSNIISYHGVRCKLVLANDVTDRMRYVEAIEKQNKTLMDISWMQSHVIRPPLSRIMGLLPMLNYCGADPDQQQVIKYLMESAQELDKVIHSITDVISEVRVK